MDLVEYTAVMVTANIVIQCIALWQRHQSAYEARRRRLKRQRRKQKKRARNAVATVL